jgi:hypothetical protein
MSGLSDSMLLLVFAIASAHAGDDLVAAPVHEFEGLCAEPI